MPKERQQVLKVFISSTYVDLKDYRQVAITVVHRNGCVPMAMEFLTAQPKEPEDVCTQEIMECNIFVGIYAHRYGFVPRRGKKSITQLEYELAQAERKDCLCFIVDQDFAWKPAMCEFEKKNELDAFLNSVRERSVVAAFRHVRDFESKFATALGKLLVERLGTPEDKRHIASGGRLIPVAPTPYIAHPQAGPFLRGLAGGQTKTLMTTRLFPIPLEDIAGVQHEILRGLSPADAARFLKAERITGTRAELEHTAELYDFHPLMLKQLSSVIRRRRGKDIRDAFTLRLISGREPQKIIGKSFDLLTRDEQKIAMILSALRSSFTFQAAGALSPKMDENRLWEVLCELHQLGFLLYSENEERFDFHPIMRSFLYDKLTTKNRVHKRAAQYFDAIPKNEKVVKLEDLAPVIELYHHLIGAGQLDAARNLMEERLIPDPLYYQLSEYDVCVELLKALFPDGVKRLPHLRKETDQAWTLGALANSYSMSGQPGNGLPLYLQQIKIRDAQGDKHNVAVGLDAVACVTEFPTGRLSAAAAHSRKAIALCQQIEDSFQEAICHRELASLLAHQGTMAGPLAGVLPKRSCHRHLRYSGEAIASRDCRWRPLTVPCAPCSLPD